MAELPKTLKSLLGDVVTMYFQAHGYHWNVEGQDFSQYHSLFESVYEDVYGSIDPIAENVRKLNDYAPLTLQRFIDERTIDFKDVEPNPKAMAKELLKTNEALLKQLNDAFAVATKENQQGIANFIAERIDMHQKWSWQLRASTK
jgi:starvation-inducible DNA-binding protein